MTGQVTGISTASETPAYLTNNAVRLDLEHGNARLNLRVLGLSRVSDLRLQLSNDHWSKYVTMDLPDAYTRDYSGEWASLFIGPSARWGPYGGWVSSAPGFRWGNWSGPGNCCVTFCGEVGLLAAG